MAIIEVKDVYKIYDETSIPVNAVNGINLKIEQGEFTAIVGPSGSGKTTLLNLIGGLDLPTRGDIVIEKTNLKDLNSRQLIDFRLNNIGFVFQAYNLIPVLTAQENVEFVMQVQGMQRHDRAAKSRAILKEVGLAGLEKRRPAELSGGQQQRVAVARALVSEPDLVLADEPTANLDSHSAENLMDLLRDLNQRHGTTFIISTHDKLVMSYAKRLIKMRDGTIEDDVKEPLKKS